MRLLGTVPTGGTSGTQTQRTLQRPDRGITEDARQPLSRRIWSSLTQTVKNIPGSALQVGKDIGTAIVNPIETAKNIGKVGLGFAEKAIPGEQKDEASANAVMGFFKERYGGLENIKNTIETDPVGFALDVAGLFSGGGALASKVPGLAKAGAVAAKIGEVLDPVNAAAKAVGGIARGVGETAAAGLGITTGAGRDVIKQAFRNPSQEFTSALRGKTTSANIVDDARDALHTIKQKRSDEYRADLAKIKGANTSSLDIGVLKQDLETRLAEFGVRRTDEGFDFSRSTIDPAETNRVQAIAETIDEWGTQKGDRTAIGLDLLKRRLDDFYSPTSKQANAFVQPLKGNVRSILEEQVPGYANMTKRYRETSELADEIQRGLSLTDRASVDTTFKKLTSTLRQNQEFRKELLDTLEARGGKDLTASLTGQQLSSIVPRGIQKYVTEVGVIGGILSGAGAIKLLPMLALASPRVVGEFVRATGLGIMKTQKLLGILERLKLDADAMAALRDLQASQGENGAGAEGTEQ